MSQGQPDEKVIIWLGVGAVVFELPLPLDCRARGLFRIPGRPALLLKVLDGLFSPLAYMLSHDSSPAVLETGQQSVSQQVLIKHHWGYCPLEAIWLQLLYFSVSHTFPDMTWLRETFHFECKCLWVKSLFRCPQGRMGGRPALPSCHTYSIWSQLKIGHIASGGT